MDMSYLKDMPIAAFWAAAALVRPWRARLRFGWQGKFGSGTNLLSQNATSSTLKTGITLSGNQFSYFGYNRKGTAKGALATDDMTKLQKAPASSLLLALAHENLFHELIPLLEDGQVIHILPDNCGTFIFRKLMRELNCTKKVIVGAWYTAPYGIRVVKRGGVTTNECKVEDRITTIRGCALPMTDNDAFMASAWYIPAFGAIMDAEGEVTVAKDGSEYHHGFVTGNTVLDINLSNVNPVIHVPGTVLGVSTMQNFDTVLGQEKKNYSLYGFALCAPALLGSTSLHPWLKKRIGQSYEHRPVHCKL